MQDNTYLRRVIFSPYNRGDGPRFTLTLWETGKLGGYGKTALRYRLRMRGREYLEQPIQNRTLFEGSDFCASPCHAIDSDATVRAIMGFLTLRPGDTDAEYFDDYTDAQRDYCEHHAEALASCVIDRFGED